MIAARAYFQNGRRDYSARLRDPASDPAQGLGATYDPACLSDPTRASGPGRHDNSACLRDSASDAARGLGTAIAWYVSVT